MGIFSRKTTAADLGKQAEAALAREQAQAVEAQTRREREAQQRAEKQERDFASAVSKTLKLLEIKPESVGYIGSGHAYRAAFVTLADGGLITLTDRSELHNSRLGVAVGDAEIGEVSWHINYASGVEYELTPAAAQMQSALAEALRTQQLEAPAAEIGHDLSS